MVIIRDLGSSLMFFGAFLALLYVATARFSFVVVGIGLFLLGSMGVANAIPHVQERIDVWIDPWSQADGAGYRIVQSLFAQADGGLFGQGFGQALLTLPQGGSILPAAHTDLIYALITDEIGIFGASAALVVFLLIAHRGFKIAIEAPDPFSKLLAAGLTAVFALQVFVIVGGVTRVIPLTGVTLPFISYGGSSIIANFALISLLMLISDHTGRMRAESDRNGRPAGVLK